MTAPPDIVLTLADSEMDNTACVAGPCTWDAFVGLQHHRREDKFHADGRKTGFSPARFAPDACTCGDPPRAASGNLPAKRGCPDHPKNFVGEPRGHRIARNVEGVTLIGIDLDKNPDGTELSAENAHTYVERLRASGLALVIWSSHSFAPPVKNNLRVFIRPTREMRPAEYKRLYGPLLDMLGVPSGIGRHPDPRRFWLFPSAREGAPVVHEVVAGGALDVDKLLAVLPPEPERAPSDAPQIPRGAALPNEDAQQRAIEILAAAWPPVGTRSAARGELAGALAWGGWGEEDIVCFLDGVTAATNGGIVDGDVHSNNCRWASSSISKIESGGVSGWPSLAARIGQEAVDAAKRALGMVVPITDEQSFELDAALADVLAASQAQAAAERAAAARVELATRAQMPPPTEIEFDACARSTQKRLAARRDPASLRDAELLRRVNAGQLLTDRSTEDPLAVLRTAALALARAVPPTTTPQQLQGRLNSSAGQLVDTLPQIVDEAMLLAVQMPPILSPPSAPKALKAPVVAADGEFELDLKGNREGRPTNNLGKNMRLALTKLGVTLRYNELAECAEITIPPGVIRGLPDGCEGRILQEDHVKQLRDRVEAFDLRPPKDEFHDLIKVVAREDSYHPVRDYLAQVEPTWDDTPRAEEWLIRAGAKDTPYVRAVSRLILVAAVHRVRRPGCLFQEMLIIEGPQGVGKSTGLAALVPDNKWFTDSFEFDKDQRKMIEATEGKWIVEVGELSKMSKNDHKELKRYLASDKDKARMAYARISEERPRQFILIGTTNEGEYLEDMTGNRRYWPVRIDKFDVAALAGMRDQLWAEAAQIETAGASIRLDPSLYDEATLEQEERRARPPIESLLARALDERVGRIRLHDAWELAGVDMIGKKRPSNIESREINAVMTRLGWIAKEKLQFGKQRERGFVKGTEEEQETVLTSSGGIVGQVFTPGQGLPSSQGQFPGGVVN